MNTFDGYIRRDGTNSKVLLDGGDAKALSSFIGTLSYNNNKITYTKADGSTSYNLVDLSNYIYNLNVATSDNLGGIKIGFLQSGKNYPVQLDSNNKAYVYVPWEENSHYTTRLYVGDGTAENKVTTNGNTKITVTDNNNVRNYITLIGSGATNISSDDNGKITINSTNTTYNTGDSTTLNKGTNTEGKLWSAKTLVDYISDILGVDSTAITSLNTLIGQLHDNDTATGILVELAKKLNTPSSSIGSNNQPIYWNGSSFTTIGYTIEKSVPSNAIFTDTKYSFYIGENNNIKEHKNISNPYFKLFENNTPTSIQIKAGTGISINSDANGNITIKNESPDQNHNTDKTGIKLGTISGTKKTDSTVIINNSSTGLTIAGGTNKFSIGDGTNYIEVPITPSFTVSNKDSTIGTSLTTIATIAGIDIKAKIDSYLPLSGGTMTGHLTIKTSSYRDQLTIYRNENNNNSVINFSNKDGFLGAIGFTGLGQTGMPEKPHVVLKDGTLYTLLHSGNTSISNETITINDTSIKVSVEGHTHNRLSCQGIMNPETGRTSERGGIYSYITNASHYTGAPAKYTSIIGFGRGTGGHGEISINWVEGSSTYTNGIWYRGLRDYQDNWYGWTHILDEHNTYISNGTITINGTSITPITSLSGYATKSETVLDVGDSITNTIYSLGAKRVFSGLNLTDAPVQGWVSGLVLGSNWNNNHYQHYLVEANDRWYTTRYYENSKMKSWNTFAYLSDIPTKVSQLTNDSGYLTSHQSLPDMIKRHTTVNQFDDTAGLRVITVSDDSTLLGSRKWGSIIQWSNHNFSPSTVNSDNWYNQLMGITDDRLYFRTRTNGGNWTNFHKVAWTSDIPTKSSWNYDDVYLKLSGGSLSGYLTISGGSSHAPLIVKGGLSGYRHNIQLIPSDNFSGILFGANDVTTEVSSTTTNSYWVGNNNGAFSIAKGGFGNASVSLYCNGTDWYVNTKKIYHTGNLPAYPTKESWNYDDRYLKLSTGGTVLGTTTFKTDSYGTQLEIYRNSNNGNPSIKFNNTNTITNRSIGFETSRNGDNALYFTDDNATNKYYVASEEYVNDLYNTLLNGYANSAGNATYANYLNLVAGNEIRFNKIPSSSIDVYFNYVWAGGIADDKINNYRFLNGNRGYAGIIAEQLSCTNGYIYLHGPGSSTYDLSSISSNSSGLTIETPRATDAQNGTVLPLMVKTRGGQWSELQTGTITANKFNGGTLELYPENKKNYSEGLRIHTATDGWTTLIFCGTDNTGTSGTSANSWGLHTNNGNFYMNRNNSNVATVNRLWGHSNGYTIGNTTESGYNFTIGGTSRFIGTTTTSHIIPASDYTYNIGSNTVEYARTFSRIVFARHLNASGPYSNDKDLYLGYHSTTNILFYTTDASGNNRKKVAQFKQDGNAIFDNTVTATSFYSSSDIRLKNIISNIQYSSEEIASLRSVKYTWKNKNEKVHIGSIAQDVERIIPEVVNIDNEGYKSLDYATLGAIGVISLAREIVELKKEIKELKSKLYG